MKKQIASLSALIICLMVVVTSCKENDKCEFAMNYYINAFTVSEDYADVKDEIKENITNELDFFVAVENKALEGELMSNSDAKKILDLAMPTFENEFKKEFTHPGITKLEIEIEMWNKTDKEPASRQYIVVIDTKKKK